MRPPDAPNSPRWLVRGVLLIVVVALLSPAAVSAISHESTDYRIGTIDRPANGPTIVSIQGFHFDGKGNEKKPARLIGVGPRGTLNWDTNGSQRGANWFYDVDPLENGNLLVVMTAPGTTTVYEFDPADQEIIWQRQLPIEDTHDVDLINGDQLLVANMRHYNETTEQNDDRIFIYDLSTDRIVWEWYFRDHGFDPDEGGEYTEDWTHVNDVDKVGSGQYMLSVRNFNQIIFVNRSTGGIYRRLGAAGDRDTMFHQHNPDYLVSSTGRPTALVADSENDRIVEYELTTDGETWSQTWELTGGLSWPRDADRLPNGNTLIVDSVNHRVVEVTPQGRIVWEVYAPWMPYDAERPNLGNEPGGPTIRDMNATGEYELAGSAALQPGTGDRLTFGQRLATAFVGTPIESEAASVGKRWDHIAPWIYPVWMTGWDFLLTILATLVVLGWAIVELAYGRQRVTSFFRRHVP